MTYRKATSFTLGEYNLLPSTLKFDSQTVVKKSILEEVICLVHLLSSYGVHHTARISTAEFIMSSDKPARCSGDHGFYSCQGLIFFFVPRPGGGRVLKKV